jgi:hypothetical protein
MKGTMMSDNDIVWKSEVTRDMVKGWSDDEIDLLIADLDDSVMLVIEDYKGSHDE